MHKILLSLYCLLCFSFFASAQFTKGSLLIGGSGGFSTSSMSGESQGGGASVVLSIGKALKENEVAGINLSFYPSWYVSYSYGNIPLSYNSYGYSFGLFYRKYKSLGKDFFLFGEVGGSYIGSVESGKDTAGIKQLSGHTSGGQIYFTPGISYKISKKLLFEITLPNIFYSQYIYQKSTLESFPFKDNSQFTIATSLSSNPLNALNIGFRLNL